MLIRPGWKVEPLNNNTITANFRFAKPSVKVDGYVTDFDLIIGVFLELVLDNKLLEKSLYHIYLRLKNASPHPKFPHSTC